MKMTTPKCIMCGKYGEVEVPSSAGYFRWKHQGVPIQTALADMSEADREQLKTGTHPACWDAMFEGVDE